MAASSPSSDPPVGLGLSSVILGAVGGLLFFLPVLSIPLGVVGLALGAIGFLAAIFCGCTSLRWSVVGIVVSGLALGIAVVIALARGRRSATSEGAARLAKCSRSALRSAAGVPWRPARRHPGGSRPC